MVVDCFSAALAGGLGGLDRLREAATMTTTEQAEPVMDLDEDIADSNADSQEEAPPEPSPIAIVPERSVPQGNDEIPRALKDVQLSFQN